MRERAAPRMAMHRPGGTNHHQAPLARASAFWAKYSIVPQVRFDGSSRPMNASPAWVRTAKITAKMNCETMMATAFGRISTSTMRQRLSP
jgi:hypothetical protein